MEVLERYAGQTGPCAICAKTITIPGNLEGTPGHANTRVATSRGSDGTSGVSLGTLLGILGGSVACLSVIFLVTVLIFRVAIPAANQLQIDRMNESSQSKIGRITKALNAYHDLHGTYPPAYFTDENGQPTHSWRVMILPQLNRNDLYTQYNFDEPWNDPSNIAVTMQMPDVYRSPADKSTNVNTTRFAAVVGKRTVFPFEKAISRSQILDDARTVMVIVEVHGIGFDWTDPTQNYDVDSPQGTLLIDNDIKSQMLTNSTLTGNVGMLNEDTHNIDAMTPVTLLQEMATRSGSEDIGFEIDMLEQR